MDRHTLKQLGNQVGELLRHGSPSCIRMARGIMAENFEAILYFALELTRPKPKPAHTIADNYPAGGLTATEPCMYCEDFGDLEAKYDALLASHKKLLEALQEICNKYDERPHIFTAGSFYAKVKQAISEAE